MATVLPKRTKTLLLHGYIREFISKSNLNIPNDIITIIIFCYSSWDQLATHSTRFIIDRMSLINNIIFYATPKGWGLSGIVQYNPKTDQLSTNKWPSNINPGNNYSCCHYKNKIYIIDGDYIPRIMVFNTTNKSWNIINKKLPRLGSLATCIAMDDFIHILGGKRNTNHLIYSIKKNTIKSINDPTATTPASLVCVVKYENKLCKFGGYDVGAKRMLTDFYMSSCIKNDEYESIEWKLEEKNKLIEGVAGCGYIVYEHFIVVLGGEVDDDMFTDKIYVLDLKRNNGWREMKHIRCPLASQYRACLDGDGNLHLFTRVNVYPDCSDTVLQHCSIPVRQILGDLYVGKNDKGNDDKSKID